MVSFPSSNRIALELSMKCPTCQEEDHRVLRTEALEIGVRRSRLCLQCGKRWHTVETTDEIYQRAASIVEAGRKFRELIGEE